MAALTTTRWNVAVSTETDQALRMFLASRGGGRKGDLSQFIEEAVRARIFELTAQEAKAANVGISEKDLSAMVEEALRARSSRLSAEHGTTDVLTSAARPSTSKGD